MFQASLSLSVLAVSYALQAKYQPFVTSQSAALAEHGSRMADVDRRAESAQAERLSRRLGRRISQVLIDMAMSGARKAIDGAEVLLDFNVLETTLLCASTAVLLGGMMFQSSQLTPGSAAYIVLTVGVGAVVIGSVLVFAVMVAAETRRTCRRPTAPPAGSPASANSSRGPSPGAAAALSFKNPLLLLRKFRQVRKAEPPEPGVERGAESTNGAGHVLNTTSSVFRAAASTRGCGRQQGAEGGASILAACDGEPSMIAMRPNGPYEPRAASQTASTGEVARPESIRGRVQAMKK